jgi:hypothetical protein
MVKEIAKGPVGIIFDTISAQESQTAALEILGPNGSLVLTRSPATDISTEYEDNRWVVLTYGEVRGHGHLEFGRVMYDALPGLLADGSIKVCCRCTVSEGKHNAHC